MQSNACPIFRSLIGAVLSSFLAQWVWQTGGLAIAAPALVERSTPSTNGQLIASPEPGWPQFRGPRRDGICDEKGLMPAWPTGGPKLIWQTNGLGQGYTAPIISRGRIYLAGDKNEQLRLFALDLNGKLIWQATNGAGWKNPYPGSRALLTLHNGRLFHLNAHGRLGCYDPQSGVEHWHVDVLDRFEAKNITWAMSECVLADGDHVIVTPGGNRSLMAALDVKTGKTVWETDPLKLGPSTAPGQERLATPAGAVDSASYGSPILVAWGGRRVIVNCSQRHIFAVDADRGTLLWTRPFPTRYLVIAGMPVWFGDGVLITAPDADGGKLFRFVTRNGLLDVEQVWTTPLDTCHGGVVKVGTMVYGSFYRHDKGWAAVDSRSGKVLYQAREWPMGSVLYADGRLYCLNQDGNMLLLQPTEGSFQKKGQFKLLIEPVGDAWAHPVICDRRLYLRYHDQLFCYDIAAR
jgi:outer membrane protein assembly factor BamB